LGVHQPGLLAWNPYATLTITEEFESEKEFESETATLPPPPSWIKDFVDSIVKGAALCRGVLRVPFAPEINQLRHVSEVIGRQRKREFEGTFKHRSACVSQDIGTHTSWRRLTRSNKAFVICPVVVS